MRLIRGYLRLSLTGIILTFGGSLIVIASLVPGTIGRYRLSFWILWASVRALLLILGVSVSCPDPEKVRHHHGFLFPNHVSYLDILVLLAVTPTRFLAKAEIRPWPVIGWAARAVGCVFVRRDDKASRAQARASIARAERYPPVTLFPEGKRGPGNELLPFRYGAFEIVSQERIPYLPCAIVYDRLKIAQWTRGEPILKAVWRLSARAGAVRATLYPLQPVFPTPEDDPVALSEEAHAQVNAVLEQHQF